MEKKVEILLMALMLCVILVGCSSMGKEEKQLLIKRTEYNENDEITGWTEFEHDEKGNVIKENGYDENGELAETVVYTYDEDGNKKEMKVFNDEGFMWEKCLYDNNGNLLERLYLGQGEDGEAYEDYKSVKSYDEQGRVKKEEIWFEGEIGLIDEYIYEGEDKEVRRSMSLNDKGEIDSGFIEESVYNDNGEVVKKYVYVDIENPEKLYSWEDYVYNTYGDCIEYRRYGADGSLWNIGRCEYLYDDMGNLIQWRGLEDFSGNLDSYISPYEISWVEISYDEWGNIVEYIHYDGDGEYDKYDKYVNEYKTIKVDKQASVQKEEKKVEKTSDKKKVEFMKAIYDCMASKDYEAIFDILETRDTLWNTLYFQNNQLVDELEDGEALIYSYGSGIYYGQVVNGKRQGQGVQWKEDLRLSKEYGNQYYYIDGEWKDNKGNGYCKIYYSLRGFTNEKSPLYAYIEGNYTDSMEDGEMHVTWLGVDKSVCTDTYQACEGEIQGDFELNDNGRYKICEDEGGSGNVLWDSSTTGKGFPRKIYDQID